MKDGKTQTQITATDWGKTVDCLLEKWSPVQIANQVGISHETIYRHVYADKAAGGSLYQQLRCQKKRKKAMPAVVIVEVRSLAEDRLVSAQSILKQDLK